MKEETKIKLIGVAYTAACVLAGAAVGAVTASFIAIQIGQRDSINNAYGNSEVKRLTNLHEYYYGAKTTAVLPDKANRKIYLITDKGTAIYELEHKGGFVYEWKMFAEQ